MARNLVKEQEEKVKEAPAEAPKPAQPEAKPEEVKIITFEALIANNIDVLNAKVDGLAKLLMEGFKQVGVNFPEEK